MTKKSTDFCSETASESTENAAKRELCNYPSIGRLFAAGETERLNGLKMGYERAQKELDLIIQKGTIEEAERASKAIKAISVTLEFLETLEKRKYR